MTVAFFPVSTWCPEVHGAILRHYTGSHGAPPGKKMAWLIFENGVRRGVVGLGEPTFKLAARRRLGLVDARPLQRTVSCFVFRLEQPGPTHASTILRTWHPVASRGWAHNYGWAPVHWETMCEPGRGEEVTGYCFRRAGYRSLGLTTGRSARRPPGHTHGKRVWSDSMPKLVLYRGPMHRLPNEIVARLSRTTTRQQADNLSRVRRADPLSLTR